MKTNILKISILLVLFSLIFNLNVNAQEVKSTTSNNTNVKNKLGMRQKLEKTYEIKPSNSYKSSTYNKAASNRSYNIPKTINSYLNSIKNKSYYYATMTLWYYDKTDKEHPGVTMITPVFYSVKKPNGSDFMGYVNAHYDDVYWSSNYTPYLIKSFDTKSEAMKDRDDFIAETKRLDYSKIRHTNFTGYE